LTHRRLTGNLIPGIFTCRNSLSLGCDPFTGHFLSGRPMPIKSSLFVPGLFVFLSLVSFTTLWALDFVVPGWHPRLFGPADYLGELAVAKPLDFQRVTEVAIELEGNDHERMISQALVYAVRGDRWCAETAIKAAMTYIEGPVRTGHETFGSDLARCALVYDLCFDLWTTEQRRNFHDYFNRTVDANVNSETSPFHNGYFSYKNWGIGMAALATWHENERSPQIFADLDREIRRRALPALAMAGDGGGWAEGYYVNYWTCEWCFFLETARRCAGVDYYGLSPEFLGQRAVASMFETYPGISERGSRRLVPMGDGAGRVFTGERDENLSVRRILVSRFRDDPDHQVVHAFNEMTPRVGASVYAYLDFLWRDTTVVKGDLSSFHLSHLSPGPGYISARSSWQDDATYFFFKCGDRFTSHQNLDNGHFLIYKREELAGQGGQFYSFATAHEVNYMLRSIAHNTILVYDPSETWPDIRYHTHLYGTPVVNDGGQHHDWPHHNGAVQDAEDWEKNRQLYDIADLLAFEDRGEYLYTAGDCSHSYRKAKLDFFTRQIVFLRPNTFVIFDRVRSTRPELRKSWLLQAMQVPEKRDGLLVVTNGAGRLFVQTLLPEKFDLRLVSGDSLYLVDGKRFPPDLEVGPAPACRVEVSPSRPSRTDYFLHVLTAADTTVGDVPRAAVRLDGSRVELSLDGTKIGFLTDRVGGEIETGGGKFELAEEIIRDY